MILEKIEKAVIAAMLTDGIIVAPSLAALNENCFSTSINKAIYEAIKNIFDKGGTIDVLSVARQLKANGVNVSISELAKLVAELPNTSSTAAHCLLLKEAAISRGLKAACSQAVKSVDDGGDTLEILNDVSKGIAALTGDLLPETEVKGLDALATTIESMQRERNGDAVKGIPLRNGNLRSLIPCWAYGTPTIIAARPGMGKTAATTMILKDAASEGRVTLVLTLEMTAQQYVRRIINGLTNKSDAELMSLSDREYEEVMNDAQNEFERLFVDDDGTELLRINDASEMSDTQIKAFAYRASLETGGKLGLVILDYAQIAKADGIKGDKTAEVSAISRACTTIAKELNVAFVVLSQLNRDCEKRGGLMRPMASDLKQSGQLEQDAYLIVMLWRAALYCNAGILDPSTLYDRDETKTLGDLEHSIEFIVTKHRGGSTGVALTGFNGPTTQVVEVFESEGEFDDLKPLSSILHDTPFDDDEYEM